MDDSRIIDLEREGPDESQPRYARGPRRGPSSFQKLTVGVLGVAVGVALFLAFLTFFIYVLLPLMAILILWSMLKGAFRSR